MTTWQELSAAEQRVLDNACEDSTQLWELGLPVTVVQQDGKGGDQERNLPAIPHAEVLRAVQRLLDLRLAELVRRTGDRRVPVSAAEHAAVLADPATWDVEGLKDIEVVATDAGRGVWRS